jgi:putative ABC transport system permease protein
MLRNYFKTAWRHLTRNRTFSAINISGLAIGMAACLLILQYVSFKLSYDQFHEHAPDIYRVVNDRYQNGKLIQHSTQTYSAIGKALQDDYPQDVAAYARVEPLWSRILIHNDKKTEESGFAVDNSFLSMFSFPLLAGDPSTALAAPNSLIVTETLARELLNNYKDDAASFIGQVMRIENDSMLYKITGVCKDIPENSHLQFSFLKSYISLYTGGNSYWKAANHSFKESYFWHYVQLKPGADYKKLQAKLPEFSQRHFEGTKMTGANEAFYLQPLSKAHLYSDFENEIGKTGSATLVWGLLLVAVFTILIAWINYINLATAKSVERAREVGVRKAAGALRGQLVRMFLFESTVINFVALLLALAVVVLVQPYFNNMVGHQLSLSFLLEKGMNGFAIIGGLLIVLVAGIFLSGYYPAFVLSSYNPVTVLKGRMTSSAKGVSLRKFLVVGQFAVTTVLIISSLVVYKQLNYMSGRGTGLDIEQVLIIKPPFLTRADHGEFKNLVDNFKDDLKQLAAVKKAGSTRRMPGNDLSRAFDVYRIDDSTSNRFTLDIFGMSHDLMDVFDMKLLAGRKFNSSDHNADLKYVHNAILNETAIKLLGFASPQDAIGKQVSVFEKTYDIVGVTADFHMKSLHHSINPTVMMPLSYTRQSAFAVKLNTENVQQTIAAIRGKYEAWFPGNLFDYYFLDESYNAQYSNDRLFGKVFTLFTGFTILIACFGLFGLSLYTVRKRIKEIGVRKVLGASVINIVMLLSRDMIRLVLIANIIAFPVAWWAMNNWLNDFAYRIDIGWWVFAAAVVIALVIAMGTLSFQAIKAALSNPVKSLRTE